jgi:hypothetical protein
MIGSSATHPPLKQGIISKKGSICSIRAGSYISWLTFIGRQDSIKQAEHSVQDLRQHNRFLTLLVACVSKTRKIVVKGGMAFLPPQILAIRQKSDCGPKLSGTFGNGKDQS